MNVNYAKFQKSLLIEQFQGNYLKIKHDLEKHFSKKINDTRT